MYLSISYQSNSHKILLNFPIQCQTEDIYFSVDAKLLVCSSRRLCKCFRFTKIIFKLENAVQCTNFQIAATTSRCKIILNVSHFRDKVNLSYSTDASSSVDDKTSSVLNDRCQLLTFVLQLHIAVFNLHIQLPNK